MKILITGGFLGSGKTSLILQLARYLTEKKSLQLAILENEIGEIGIDDVVLRGSGLQVRGLFAGCVCCTLAGELPITVREIEREIAPDLLIIEATGVAFPYEILENLERNVEITPGVLCIVDAKRWDRLFKPMENLFRHQLMHADVILVNKADLVDEETLNGVIASVKTLNPEAKVFASSASGDTDEALMESIASEVC